MTAKLTPAQKSFAAHYRRQHGSDWFSVPYNYNQLRIAGNLVKKGVLQRRMDKVSGQHEYRFTPDAKYKVDDRVHHDGLCLTVTDVAFSDLMNEYSYAVRKNDGGLMPFFMRLLESELKPCDCKPTTKAAALPAAATLTVSEPFGIQFAEGDQVRVNRTRMLSYVQEVRGEDVRLENGNWYHLGELTLFRKAPEKALCSVCEEYRAGIVTRDGVDICQHCTAKAEAPFQVGDWVREKGHPVNVGQITDIITHETGLISHPVTVRFKTTFYRFNLWNARDLEPVDPPVSFVLIGRGELSTARRPVKIAGLLPASCANYPAEKMAYEHALKTFPGTTPYIRVERDGYGIGYVTFQGGEKFYPMKQAWKTMKAHGVDNPAVRLDVRGQIVQIRPYEEVAYGVATC